MIQPELFILGIRVNLLAGLAPIKELVENELVVQWSPKLSNVYKTEGQGLENGWLAELWAVIRLSAPFSLQDLQKEVAKWRERYPAELTLLACGETVRLDPMCPVPNPNLHRRRIFLQCAAEIEPNYLHPVLKTNLLQLVNRDQRPLNGEFFAQGRQVYGAL